MKRRVMSPQAPIGAAPSGAPDPPDASRLSERLRGLRQGYLQVFGIPDYERYLAHLESHHPGEPALSRREFYLKTIERKYNRSGPRCC